MASRRRGNAEGSVYKRQDGKWVAALTIGWVRGKRQRRTAVGAKRADAVKRLAELQQAAEQGLGLDAERVTVADLLERWLESARPKLRPLTLGSYQMIVRRHLIPALGRVRLKKLTTADVDAYLCKAVEGGLSGRTVGYHRAVLRRAIGQAESWDLIARNVARRSTPPSANRFDVQPLTPDQARAFLAGIESDRLFALYATAISLGLRQGEALGLRWEDVDLEERTLTVRRTLQRYAGAYHLDEPKTERSRRTVSLPEPLVDALRRHSVQQKEEKLKAGGLWAGERWKLIFCNETGEPLSGNSITHRFQEHLAALGLPHQRFHDLRHAAASFLIAQGVPLRVVMEVLGHSTITTTANVYGHVLPEMGRDATDRVGRLLFAVS